MHASTPPLDPLEFARYSRHLTLPEVGIEGQLKLRAASVVVVGTGGLGAPLVLYLAAVGIGRIGIVDFDRVDLSNLQRQILYTTADVGRTKVECARERVLAINPHVKVDLHDVRLDAANALEILAGYDVVVDGTDNFPTRYLVNDACVLLGKPNVYGSIFRFEGQASVFWAQRGPCYRCLYPEPPAAGAVPNCAEGGVLGVLPGIVGSIQATEVIKLVLGRGESLIGRLLLFDALEMRFREMKLRKAADCPVCSDAPSIQDLKEITLTCERPEDSNLIDIGANELHERLKREPRPLLLDVRGTTEWAICHLDGAQLIPLPDLESRLSEVDRSREIVVYCHSGIRSARAARILAAHGYDRVQNLAGGIDAWSREVDSTLPRY